ncbi:MAG: transposase [Steroidobacteraceae bacterium]
MVGTNWVSVRSRAKLTFARLRLAGVSACPSPTESELQALVQQIAARIGRVLEQRGVVERDMENAWLATQGAEGPLDDLIGHSITYRIAVGPRTGQKLFTLQTVPPRAEEAEQQGDHRSAANAGGFSLHAGVDIQPHQREKLERLCRYVSRPPIAVERLALTSLGQVRYPLKTAYHDGTTHIVLDALDLMARLSALVPPSQMHLTRLHGVFAPHSKAQSSSDRRIEVWVAKGSAPISQPTSPSPRAMCR